MTGCAQDIGIASPLYDLCGVLGIRCVYSLPIDLIPWPVPYPTGVPWPVMQYGPVEEGRDRRKGYIVVAPGGKARLWVYGHNRGESPAPSDEAPGLGLV